MLGEIIVMQPCCAPKETQGMEQRTINALETKEWDQLNIEVVMDHEN
jgi:hypothetical protein